MQENFNGLLLVNKPSNISSFQALNKIKKHFAVAYNQKIKVGHTGTLDPFAKGLLILCFGKATKVNAFLLGADKSYQATLQLGAKTTTADFEGEILAEAKIPHLTTTEITNTLAKFIGINEQTPPFFSALKHQGKKLYQLAREGVYVQKPARKIKIKDCKLIDFSADKIKFFVHCSKGTYIRVLGEEIAEDLSTYGHLIELERLSIAGFNLQDSYDLTAILKHENPIDLTIASDIVFQNLTAFYLLPSELFKLLNGQVLNIKDIKYLEQSNFELDLYVNSDEEKKYRIYAQGTKQFLGLAKLKHNNLKMDVHL